MTKKSQARLQRDMEQGKVAKQQKKEFKNNKCWDELNGMYSNVKQLLGSHAHLAIHSSNKELISYLVDKNLFANNVQILAH